MVALQFFKVQAAPRTKRSVVAIDLKPVELPHGMLWPASRRAIQQQPTVCYMRMQIVASQRACSRVQRALRSSSSCRSQATNCLSSQASRDDTPSSSQPPRDPSPLHPCTHRPFHQTSPPSSRHTALAAGLLLAAAGLGASAAFPEAAHAFEIQAEPSNALSLPTWAIHVSSVLEWVTAMGLFWRYAEVTGNPLWKGMTWGMLPSLGSATCACVWHLFYNAPSLEFLVALQALLTVIGNTTCLAAAYRLCKASQEQQSAS